MAEVLSLHITIHVFVAGGDNSRFNCSGRQLLEINVLRCLGDHFKNIEELLLFKLNQLAQLSRPYFLRARGHMINSLASNEHVLLGESSHICGGCLNFAFLRLIVAKFLFFRLRVADRLSNRLCRGFDVLLLNGGQVLLRSHLGQ